MEASERFTNERTILSTCAHELHRLRASTSTPACPKRQESERQRTILKFDSLPTGGREGRLQKGGRPQARVGWVGVDILFFEDLCFLSARYINDCLPFFTLTQRVKRNLAIISRECAQMRVSHIRGRESIAVCVAPNSGPRFSFVRCSTNYRLTVKTYHDATAI